MFLTQFATWFNSFFPRHRMTLKRFQWNTFFYYVTFLLHSESQKVRCGFAFDNLDRFCLSTRKREFIANSRFDTCAVEFGQCVREHVRSRRTKIEIKTLHNAKINKQNDVLSLEGRWFSLTNMQQSENMDFVSFKYHFEIFLVNFPTGSNQSPNFPLY
jgi:hypothetical protein